MSYLSLLNDTCTIQARTVTYSTTKAATTTYADKATSVKCTIQPNTGNLANFSGTEKLNITHLAFFPIGTSIVASDKIIDSSGNEYIAVRVFDAAGRVRHLEVGLELLAKA